MTKDTKLPELEAYTREQLAKKWGCDTSLIKGYIDSGQLREALPPTAKSLRKKVFYKCEDNEPILDAFDFAKLGAGDSRDWLLGFIQNFEPLEKYVGKIEQERIIPCPKHLYMPIDDNAIIKRPNKDHSHVRYFYDSRGNALIPIYEDEEGGWLTSFAFVKKKYLASLIIRIEEVRRFIRKGKKNSPVIMGAKEKTGKQEREDSGNQSFPRETTDNVPDRQRLDDDVFIDIKEVKRRVNKSASTIYSWMKEGSFPQSIKSGGRTDWRKSDIDAYLARTWKPTKDEDNGKEADE